MTTTTAASSKRAAHPPPDASSSRTKRKHDRDLQEEAALEALVFGTTTSKTRHKHNSTDTSARRKESLNYNHAINNDDEDDVLFEIDREGDRLGEDDDVHDHGASTEPKSPSTSTFAAAWIDEDDHRHQTTANTKTLSASWTSRTRKLRVSRTEDFPSTTADYADRLRTRFQASTSARVDWATTTSRSGDDNDSDVLLSSSTPLLSSSSSSSKSLPPHFLGMVRCRDANQGSPHGSVVQSVHFHPSTSQAPSKPLLLTAGLDKLLQFYQVGQDESEKVHGIHFPKLPIYAASFVGTTGNVVVSGRRPFFYLYDAVAGKVDLVPRILGRQEKSLERHCVSPDGSLIAFYGNDGYVILVDVRSRQWLADLKMNGSVRALSFSPNAQYLYGSGSDGQVYQWDVASRRCVDRFDNQDGTISSSLACSDEHVAVGAESGVVNLYNAKAAATQSDDNNNNGLGSPRPLLKSIMNLKTSSDLVRFNHDGQILAISSRRERQALKLVHVPTRTVFSNWPTTKTPLNYVWSLDFSPDSKFLAVGNDKGKCLLYRLTHYDKE